MPWRQLGPLLYEGHGPRSSRSGISGADARRILPWAWNSRMMAVRRLLTAHVRTVDRVSTLWIAFVGKPSLCACPSDLCMAYAHVTLSLR